MFIELLDILRCVRPHEDSWLVGSFDELVDRHVIRGTLGCPVCGTEYPVAEGIADFRTGLAGDATPDAAMPVADVGMPGESEALRLAALLDLAEPGGVVVLMGQWASSAPALEAFTAGVQLLLVNPVTPLFPFASAVRTGSILPIADDGVRAVAYDAGGVKGVTAERAARVVRPGGRLVAPQREPVPSGIKELARDDSAWVGEREATAAHGVVVRLTRRK